MTKKIVQKQNEEKVRNGESGARKRGKSNNESSDLIESEPNNRQ